VQPRSFPSEALTRLRSRWVPDQIFGELLSKSWIDTAVPATFLLVVAAVCLIAVPSFALPANLSDGARQLGELGLVVLGMMIVVIGGGIDLSVGSNFALGNFLALSLTNIANLPTGVVLMLVMSTCGLVGLVNGVLIGLIRLRAFLTTLVTLIAVRAVVDMLLLRYAVEMSSGLYDSKIWDFIGGGSVLGLPFSFVVFAIVAALMHVVLSRMRIGWHIMAVGGSRRSAHNSGIRVRATVCGTYVASGLLCGAASFLYAARLANGGADAGVGLEVLALTAVMVGGTSLGGGRGSVAKSVIGAIIVQMISLSVVQLGLESGAGQFVLGAMLLLAIGVDMRWTKNRDKILSRVYVSPTYFRLPEPPETEEGSGSPFAVNNRLSDVDVIGLGQVDGAEDIIFDNEDYLYCGDRRGKILRFAPPNYENAEIFAHIGGHPLGMAFDRENRLVVCVGGMGLYRVERDGSVEKLTDETNRSSFSIIDDSPMRLADDLDIAPDGRIFFSEATVRFGMSTWPADALESRGNGRIICYDPSKKTTRTVLRKLVFPNGITLASNGQSILFAESWACRVSRYWFDGPKQGTVERVVENLPGYPDNINRASDGTYWMALLGMRSPALDLALRMPGFRKRMAQEIAEDEWLFPNINTGCVLRFTEAGEVLESLWDSSGVNHQMVTSMREHRGSLYLGGLLNDRIGRYRLKNAAEHWTGPGSYWGAR
jgi:ribose transport system permease protein